jgi:hypothetical protein
MVSWWSVPLMLIQRDDLTPVKLNSWRIEFLIIMAVSIIVAFVISILFSGKWKEIPQIRKWWIIIAVYWTIYLLELMLTSYFHVGGGDDSLSFILAASAMIYLCLAITASVVYLPVQLLRKKCSPVSNQEDAPDKNVVR